MLFYLMIYILEYILYIEQYKLKKTENK